MILSRLRAQMLPAVVSVPIAIAGCATNAPAAGYTPITGIEVSATDIVAGHGCGTRPGQVYKYAVVVTYATDDGGAPFTSGVFDCFTDGIFSNLPVRSGVSQRFALSIYAYDYASFPQALDCPPSTIPCPGDDAGTVQPWENAATFTVNCTVTELLGVTAIATCSPSDAGSTQSDANAE